MLRSALLMTPRTLRSRWSRANKERVARLTEAGLMAPAGLAAVEERARESGAWTALDAVEDLVEPDDLRAALAADPAALGIWNGFPRSARRGILEWILDAKRPETREKRIRVTVEDAAAGRRANQWRTPPGG